MDAPRAVFRGLAHGTARLFAGRQSRRWDHVVSRFRSFLRIHPAADPVLSDDVGGDADGDLAGRGAAVVIPGRIGPSLPGRSRATDIEGFIFQQTIEHYRDLH